MKKERQAGGSNPNAFASIRAATSLLVVGIGLFGCSGSDSSSAAASHSDDALFGIAAQAMKPSTFEFEMVRSQTALGANCIPDAKAHVRIRALGPVEIMHVDAE